MLQLLTPSGPSSAVGMRPIYVDPVPVRERESAKMVLPRPPSLERFTSGRCFKISKRICLTYSLGAFQTAAFARGLREIESACEFFNRNISIPYRLS